MALLRIVCYVMFKGGWVFVGGWNCYVCEQKLECGRMGVCCGVSAGFSVINDIGLLE